MTIDITGISPTSAVDRVAAALEVAQAMEAAEAGTMQSVDGADVADAVHATQAASSSTVGAEAVAPRHPQAAETLLHGGFVERILGDTTTATASAPAPVPGERADRNVETTTLQTHLRPTTVLPERPQTAMHADAAVPSGSHARTDFALPSSLLVPATLVGLQVEPAMGWPLTGRARDIQQPSPAPVQDADERPVPVSDEDEAGSDEEAGTPQEDTKSATACDHVFEADGDDTWCDTLTAVLREALASKIPPRALLLAAEQWQRGRCVVLACPQTFDPAGPAWAFVLWPRRPASGSRAPAGQPAPLRLSGLRVDARLQWTSLPRGPKWLHVRVIKEHHPQRGRQLIPNTPGTNGPVECEVQLGPVLARTLRCCDVCVRVQAAQRFWSALGTQWSMQVVVSAMPLLPGAERGMDAGRTEASR